MAQVSVRLSAHYVKHKDYSFVGCDAGWSCQAGASFLGSMQP